MKIPQSIRAYYAELVPGHDRLQKKVDELLRPLAAKRKWFYDSRLKTEDSFALKLESGSQREIEDFFACVIVVQNLSVIDEAESAVKSLFKITERRPRDPHRTHKDADKFLFDDLRLYGYWKDDPSLPPAGLSDQKFEIQIKTFLQHAWGIATHDLIYKTDDVSWSRQRIAYQVKAMLEHAEISIQEADRLAQTAALAKSQRDTDNLKNLIQIFKETWDSDALPSDLKRLAENTRNVLTLAQIGVNDLLTALQAERVRQNGALPINISPYGIIVQAVAWHKGDALRAGLLDKKSNSRIFVADEMELPAWIEDPALINIVRINKSAAT